MNMDNRVRSQIRFSEHIGSCNIIRKRMNSIGMLPKGIMIKMKSEKPK